MMFPCWHALLGQPDVAGWSVTRSVVPSQTRSLKGSENVDACEIFDGRGAHLPDVSIERGAGLLRSHPAWFVSATSSR